MQKGIKVQAAQNNKEVKNYPKTNNRYWSK